MKSRVKTWQVRGIWSQQLEHKQVPKWGRNQTNGKYLTPLIHTKMYHVTENKKYLDRFLFYFYFYFAPSTQIFLKISRKTFYKKKLALGFHLTNDHNETCEEDSIQHWVWCIIGCSLFRKAECESIIVKHTLYTRCLLNTRGVAKCRIKWSFTDDFQLAVLFNLAVVNSSSLTHVLCTLFYFSNILIAF